MPYKTGLAEKRKELLQKELNRIVPEIIKTGIEKLIIFGSLAIDSVSKSSDDDFDNDFVKLQSYAASLDKYYIPTRYPDALPGGIPSKAFDEEDAARAISLADKIIGFIKTRVRL